MTRTSSRLSWIISTGASVASIAFRLLPFGIRPPNLAPVGATGVYGGSKLPFWAAIAMPLGIMAVSDTILNVMRGDEGFNPFVYVSIAMYVCISRLMLRRTSTTRRVAFATVLGSLQFFLLTNLGTWIHEATRTNGIYSADIAGLTTCFVKALPFLTFTVVGDLGFSLLFLGVHEWLAASQKSSVSVQETAS